MERILEENPNMMDASKTTVLSKQKHSDYSPIDETKFVKFNKRSCFQIVENFIVISQTNDLLNTWNFLMMFVGIGSSAMYGFFAAFRKDVEFESYTEY